MGIVEIIRHGDKEGTRLSEKGRTDAFLEGIEYREKYGDELTDRMTARASDFQSEPGYPGRAVETAILILMGAGLRDKSTHVSPRLVPTYTNEEYATIKDEMAKKDGRTIFEITYEHARDSLYANAIKLAEYIDSFRDSDLDLGVTHSPSVEGLAYLLTGDYELAKRVPDALDGIKIEYDTESEIYTVTLDYCGGYAFEIEGQTLAQKCYASKELIDQEQRMLSSSTLYESSLDDAVEEAESGEGESGERQHTGSDGAESGESYG
jgi:hypothetical protein